MMRGALPSPYQSVDRWSPLHGRRDIGSGTCSSTLPFPRMVEIRDSQCTGIFLLEIGSNV